MIATLEYRTGNDVNAFFEDAQHQLLLCNAVHLVLEPGDGTRYELTVVELPSERKTQVMCFTAGGFCPPSRCEPASTAARSTATAWSSRPPSVRTTRRLTFCRRPSSRPVAQAHFWRTWSRALRAATPEGPRRPGRPGQRKPSTARLQPRPPFCRSGPGPLALALRALRPLR